MDILIRIIRALFSTVVGGFGVLILVSIVESAWEHDFDYAAAYVLGVIGAAMGLMLALAGLVGLWRAFHDPEP